VSLSTTSDKVFWHGYVEFYERFFAGRDFKYIAEIGIFKGNSIRWLLGRFPNAMIYGADILNLQPEWPLDPRFRFSRVNQSQVDELHQFFSQAPLELIIEDGSHVPSHQVLGLVEGIQALSAGGLYILEDVHTSHPSARKRSRGLFGREVPIMGNAMSVLLAIDHYQRIGAEITGEKAKAIASHSIVTPDEVILLARQIAHISMYKRTRLPDYCFKCGASDYNFSAYHCQCGVNVFSDSDSMAFVIEKR
jgi:hypothetical protein